MDITPLIEKLEKKNLSREDSLLIIDDYLNNSRAEGKNIINRLKKFLDKYLKLSESDKKLFIEMLKYINDKLIVSTDNEDNINNLQLFLNKYIENEGYYNVVSLLVYISSSLTDTLKSVISSHLDKDKKRCIASISIEILDIVNIYCDIFGIEYNISERFSKEEELKLARNMQNGDASAREMLIKNYGWLVESIAKKFHNHDIKMPLADYIQTGYLGLLKAVDKFDPSKGCRLSTYATQWIIQEIKFAINRSRPIQIPYHILPLQEKVNAAAATLEGQLGRKPTMKELSKCTGLAVEEIKKVSLLPKEIASLDEPIGEGENTSLESVTPDKAQSVEDTIDAKELPGIIKEFLLKSGLTEVELAVLKVRYFSNSGEIPTLGQTGKQLGRSREGIRKIEIKALGKLRKSPFLGMLSGYCPNLLPCNSRIFDDFVNHGKGCMGYSGEEIDDAISSLKPEQQAIIEKRFGEKLKGPDIIG